MKDRILRLKTIRKLIKNNRIESQDELLNYLQNEGFEVTQATLSRDLKLMKVGKISDGHNGYVYTIPEDEIEKESEQIYIRDFLRGYVSIEASGNIIEIIGTIAGENCIFACLREGVQVKNFLEKLKEKIPELEI